MSAFSFSARAGLCCGLLLWLLAGCIDPYSPDAVSAAPNYLVVDGFINADGISQVKLSRTHNIAAQTPPPVEARATVLVEEEGGPRFVLRESQAGTYASDPQRLNPTKRYRLRITAGSKEYASDFVPVKITPPIDNITWQPGAEGVDIYVNAHDDTRATQYYRWDYDETWEIATPIRQELEYSNRQFRPNTTTYPARCWASSGSTDINLSKTTGLSQDIVSNYRLRTLPASSPLLAIKYSILVRQYAQTRDEYLYWDLLKKNTESIGTLFDPLPSQLTGNVRCLTDEKALALGFVGAHSVTEKRIFISLGELPRTWRPLSAFDDCIPPDTLDFASITEGSVADHLDGVFAGRFYVPIAGLYKNNVLWGYALSTIDCVDCRRRGTATRPSFWQ